MRRRRNQRKYSYVKILQLRTVREKVACGVFSSSLRRCWRRVRRAQRLMVALLVCIDGRCFFAFFRSAGGQGDASREVRFRKGGSAPIPSHHIPAAASVPVRCHLSHGESVQNSFLSWRFWPCVCVYFVLEARKGVRPSERGDSTSCKSGSVVAIVESAVCDNDHDRDGAEGGEFPDGSSCGNKRSILKIARLTTLHTPTATECTAS